MNSKINSIVFILCALVILFSIFISVYCVFLPRDGVIVDKEIIQSQYITSVQGPPLYIERGYKITIHNGWGNNDILVDENTYNQFEIGDIY